MDSNHLQQIEWAKQHYGRDGLSACQILQDRAIVEEACVSVALVDEQWTATARLVLTAPYQHIDAFGTATFTRKKEAGKAASVHALGLVGRRNTDPIAAGPQSS
jgi:hypothetical protein